MFDTHCHLNFDLFSKGLDSTIFHSREHGVNKFLVPGVNFKSSKKAVELTDVYEDVYAAVGIHPTEDLDKINFDRALYLVEEMAGISDKVVGIGETGLDYYKYKSSPFLQKKYFASQMRLASKLGKTLIIHNRHATDDIMSLVTRNFTPQLKGKIVFHCCPPETELLTCALKYNIYIGVCGDLTYDAKKAEYVKRVPLDRLVLETDSPNLIPEPKRATKKFPNSPENLVAIAMKTAMLKQVDLELIIKATSTNANKLFGIKRV